MHLQINDMKQQITISITRRYTWEDARILINFSHPYWRGLKGNVREYINLDGEFVEKCLWMPKLQLFDSREMKLYNPTPTNLDKTPLKVSLAKSGHISVTSINFQLTMNCVMNFQLYPFDKQVNDSVRKKLNSSF